MRRTFDGYGCSNGCLMSGAIIRVDSGCGVVVCVGSTSNVGTICVIVVIVTIVIFPFYNSCIAIGPM